MYQAIQLTIFHEIWTTWLITCVTGYWSNLHASGTPCFTCVTDTLAYLTCDMDTLASLTVVTDTLTPCLLVSQTPRPPLHVSWTQWPTLRATDTLADSPTERIITLRITSERITSESINTERITSYIYCNIRTYKASQRMKTWRIKWTYKRPTYNLPKNLNMYILIFVIFM